MPAAAEEFVGDDPGQDLVQSLGQSVAHGDTWMQRSTYCFVDGLQVANHLGGNVDGLEFQRSGVVDVSGLGEDLEDGGSQPPPCRFIPLRHVGGHGPGSRSGNLPKACSVRAVAKTRYCSRTTRSRKSPSRGLCLTAAARQAWVATTADAIPTSRHRSASISSNRLRINLPKPDGRGRISGLE